MVNRADQVSQLGPQGVELLPSSRRVRSFEEVGKIASCGILQDDDTLLVLSERPKAFDNDIWRFTRKHLEELLFALVGGPIYRVLLVYLEYDSFLCLRVSPTLSAHVCVGCES